MAAVDAMDSTSADDIERLSTAKRAVAAWQAVLAQARPLVRHPLFPWMAGAAAILIVGIIGSSLLFAGRGDPHDALEQGLKHFFDQRYAEAEEQLMLAAKQGSGLAEHYLARLYSSGLGVKRDGAQALEWALRGAQ